MPRAAFLKAAIVKNKIKKKKKKYAQDLWLCVLNAAIAPLPKNGAITQKNATLDAVYGLAYKTWPLFSCLSRVFKNAVLVCLGLHFYKRGLKKRGLRPPRFVVKEGGAACYSKSTISKKLLNKLAMLHIEKKNVS